MPANSSAVADHIRARLRDPGGLSIVWVSTAGSRGVFADELNDALDGLPAVAIPVRGRMFENQNAVLADVARLLRKNRSLCEEQLADPGPGPGPVCIALVANAPLGLAQSSSPVELPDWFPMYGGTAPLAQIEDFSRSPTTRLNDPIADIPGVCRAIYALEESILERMRQVGSDGRELSALLAQGGRVYDHSDWVTSHRKVRDAGGFRPSTRDVNSFSGGVWRYAQRAAEEDRGRAVTKLAEALALPSDPPLEWTEGILAVLSRPASRAAGFPPRFARAVIAEIGGACQFVTSAMHSGEYHLYSISLMDEFSAELRRSLQADARLLRLLD